MSFLEDILMPVVPLYLILLSAFFLPHTIFSIVRTSNYSALLSWGEFKNHWFARFWIFFGPRSQIRAEPSVRPLLTHIRGSVILDIGPGQGHFLKFYDLSKGGSIFAVEPNTSHHPALRENARKAGLIEGQNFTILDSKIETLEAESGISRGSVDTIVTLQVLCSIPNPEVLIPELRTYLKPHGGRWIVYEHVRRDPRDLWPLAVWQKILNRAWPQFFNGCSLTRDTKQWIENSGRWSRTEGDGSLKRLEGDPRWSVIPTVCGVLVSE